MDDRIEQELDLLRRHYSEVHYLEEGYWVLIQDYQIPPGPAWNCQASDIIFQIPSGYPGTPPYGFYVPSGISCDGRAPESYKEPAENKPPWPGEWGFFSWQHDGWRPSADLLSGSNLVNLVRSFSRRFEEGA